MGGASGRKKRGREEGPRMGMGPRPCGQKRGAWGGMGWVEEKWMEDREGWGRGG